MPLIQLVKVNSGSIANFLFSNSEMLSLVEKKGVEEVLLALNATMEGETTSFYIYKKLAHVDLKISNIARGVAVGGELEYTDEVTLGRSIQLRTPYEVSLKR